MATFGNTLDAYALDPTTGLPLPGVELYAWADETGGTPLLSVLSGLDGSFGWEYDTTADGQWVSAGLTGPRVYVPNNDALAARATTVYVDERLATKANAAALGVVSAKVDTTETRVGTVEDEVAGRLSAPVLSSTIAAAGKSADTLARAEAMAFAARPQHLSRWRTKLATDAANAKIVGMGDSTTDAAVEAAALWNRLKTYHTAAGQGLAGMNAGNIVSVGHNGSKLSDWWSNSAWKAEVTGSGAHLVILSYGINDFRLGATTQAAFRTALIQAVDYLRTQMPTTDIVLRIPNSLASDNPDAYAVGWVMPATPEASQKYSTELRNAYLSLIGYWPDGVAVWDAQGRIFGVTSKTVAESGLMKDILHPSAAVGYPAIADALVADLIGRDAVPAVTPLPPKPVLDIVGRANNATSPGLTTSGHAYEVTFGALGVSNNQLYLPTAQLTRALIETGVSNLEVGATFAVTADKQSIFFRYANSGAFCYITNQSAVAYEVFKYENSTATLIATVPGVTPANGDRLRLQVDGTLCRVFINDVLRGSYSIPATAGTKVGIQATTTVPRWSEFYAKAF